MRLEYWTKPDQSRAALRIQGNRAVDKLLAERAAESVTYLFDVREQAVSQWIFDHGTMAGRTTDTLPAAKGLYRPLRTSQGIVGVLGVHPSDPQRLVDPGQLHLLEAFANQIALAIE